MNKQELIDKAVEFKKGLISEANKAADLVLYDGDGFYFVSTKYARGAVANDEGEIVCSVIEFEQRARELGWCNGYKYGVEYETNGKKPDFPDDLMVQVKFYKENLWRSGSASLFLWSNVTSFRVNDDRYKPVDVKPVKADWYDYDKQQAIALPPVGVECEWSTNDGHNWHKTKLIFSDNTVFLTSAYQLYKIDDPDVLFRPLDWNRKAEEERDATVNAAFKSLTIANDYFAYKICQDLYDNGYLKNKAAS